MHMLLDAFDRLMMAFCTLFGVLIGGMVLVVCMDVFLRNMGIGALPWGVEVTEYVLYGGTFLVAPWLLRQGRHVRVDIIPTLLPPVWRGRLDVAISVTGAIVSAIMTYYGAIVVLDAYKMHTLQFKNLVVEEWLLFLPLTIGCAMLTVEFVLRIAGIHSDPGDGELAEILAEREPA